MIHPTNGRIVWFEPRLADQAMAAGQPLSAMITHVWSDHLVNLVVFTPNGQPQSRASVHLVQEGEEAPTTSHARWMPYQLGQARAATPPATPPATPLRPDATPLRPTLHKPQKKR